MDWSQTRRIPAWAGDLLIVVALALPVALSSGTGAADHVTARLRVLNLVLVAPQTVPLLARRRWPGAVLAVLGGLAALRLWLG